ncbi:peptidylprolyl isomerase [Cellulomonas composti]|uniref:peptidylprolyl isomerase n=1 Tax=Cellulomonas composti TaxID=266130 RepID=A0A511J6M2_9CELL|nr:peptidylprolyl isomerase [Cellulomonas composti]GEL93656.1 hypothetical protein CCO02nite_03140 [Cellulomonas composti]
MSSKREREYERRRYEKRQVRVAKADMRRHQRQVIATIIVVAIVAVIGVVGVVAATSGDDTAAGDGATSTPVVDATAPVTAEPTPEVTRDPLTPDPSVAEARTWTGDLTLNSGDIGIELDGAAAPQAVANFVTLAQQGFFDGTKCHRLTTDGIYVLQCGDPEGTGGGGPGYSWGPIENAPTDDVYPAGTIAMARVGNDGASMGSQFFLVYEDSTIPSDSAGGYTVFGHITSGLDVVTTIADAGTVDGASDGAPVNDVIIEGVKIQ